MKLIGSILSVLILFVTILYSQDCDAADKELNAVYKQILVKYKSDTLFISMLKKTQNLWIKYRDAHIQTHFPLDKGETTQEKYGSIYKQCECFDIEVLTRERIILLRHWLDEAEEGDVCSGSVRN